jgi:hypothetical protein
MAICLGRPPWVATGSLEDKFKDMMLHTYHESKKLGYNGGGGEGVAGSVAGGEDTNWGENGSGHFLMGDEYILNPNLASDFYTAHSIN